MNILIFAGGAGTRLWPLSRTVSPKQFETLKDNTSTLQMAIERIRPFGLDNVYISTNDTYIDLVKEQIPDMSANHIMGEPARRDLAAAVGLALLRLKKQGVSGPLSMLWADHFMDHSDQFRDALQKAETLIIENPDRFIFLAEHARFANHNLGWIHVGDEIGDNVYQFEAWKYRPELLACQDMFESGSWFWNPGYFVFDIDFVLDLYRHHQPDMFASLDSMVNGHADIQTEYEKLDALSFDNAIVEKVSADQAVVLKVNLGWSDPGTLYALKEAFEPDITKNYTQGNVVEIDNEDCFIFNEEEKKLVSTIGLKGMVVVNTKDATLVCHKDDVPRVKELLAKMKNKGLETYL